MTQNSTVDQQLIHDIRKVREDFDKTVSAYTSDLWNYCRYLTGSPWDGEDLFQDTMLKAIGLLSQRWSEITDRKNYLFRIATNTWFDQCRREKRMVGLLDEKTRPGDGIELIDHLILEEALHLIESHLPPKQVAAFLLFDVFQFSAEEVSGMVKSTTGGVFASVQRARKKLATIDMGKKLAPSTKRANEKIIQAYLAAFNNGDFEEMLSLFSEQAENEAYLGFQEYSKDEMRKGSLRFGLQGYSAREVILWERPVIIVLTTGTPQTELHDIQLQEVENHTIVSHRSYFFRKEFILAAAKELGLKPQLQKPPVDWS
ncbi:sigma-70 family RNA polymerase sigma factor [Bacillus haimaensis]|uniref:sigma-70 family RNA polymerase sigma factor n=1 Tax=Bacillus haimaensis TaxID=3160967 RepID=UPI003AA89939